MSTSKNTKTKGPIKESRPTPTKRSLEEKPAKKDVLPRELEEAKETAFGILKLVWADFKSLFEGFWLKLNKTAFGEAFLHLHFIAKSKDWVVEPKQESKSEKAKRDFKVGFWNLTIFFFYAYFTGFLGFGWMIYLPLISNLGLVSYLYIRSLVKRVNIG